MQLKLLPFTFTTAEKVCAKLRIFLRISSMIMSLSSWLTRKASLQWLQQQSAAPYTDRYFIAACRSEPTHESNWEHVHMYFSRTCFAGLLSLIYLLLKCCLCIFPAMPSMPYWHIPHPYSSMGDKTHPRLT